MNHFRLTSLRHFLFYILTLCVACITGGLGGIPRSTRTTFSILVQGEYVDNKEFPLYSVQYKEADTDDDRTSTPLTSTMFYDQINLEKAVNRVNTWYQYLPNQLRQPICQFTGDENRFKMTDAQIQYSGATGNQMVWDRGHLTPAEPNLFSQAAMQNTHLCINAVPQEFYSNRCVWKNREKDVTDFLNMKEAGIIITGISQNTIVETAGGYPTPEYVWKLFCYKDDPDSDAVVVGLRILNTLIPNKNAVVRQDRIRESTVLRNQVEIKSLVLGGLVEASWYSSSTLRAGRPGDNIAPTADECAGADTVPLDVVNEWNGFMKQQLARGYGQFDNEECEEQS